MTDQSIGVLYGRGVRSGGPEALHQLVDALRGHGYRAGLVPHRSTLGERRASQYSHYNAPETGFNDRSGAVLIAPEVYLPELLTVKSATGACWWLSIDNSPMFRAKQYAGDLRRGVADRPRLRDLRAFASLVQSTLQSWPRRLSAFHHAAQSVYAREYLASVLGARAHMLTDYIPGAHDLARAAVPPDAGTPVVAFNPAKGHRLLRRVQEAVEDRVEWLPLVGMTPDEVHGGLRRSSVYLDLGSHPGRDRIPREASLCGAVVIVGSRGSAAFHGDVPLADRFVVGSRGRVPVGDAVAALADVLSDPVRAWDEQRTYRTWILTQEATFRSEARDFAEMLLQGS